MKRADRKEENTALGTQRVKVAVIQTAPVTFDRKNTLKKADTLAGKAAPQGAQSAILGRR